MALYSFVETVDAFDYSAKSVAKADETYPHSKITRWVGDIAKDVPRRQYDLVVSFQVFEHLNDPSSYFRFCRAACRPGGVVAIFTPNRLRMSNRLRIRKGLAPLLLDPQHFKEYTAPEIRELGGAAGFHAAGYFAYGIDGLPMLNRLSNRAILGLGALVPRIGSGVCVLLRAPG
jgi:SAM-dependent methyltransferase